MHPKKIDLHIHSRYSDGLLWPRDIVEYAAKRNVCAISITDHDTVAGVDDAIQYGKKSGIEVIPGIEISVSWENRELHFLGYYIDHHHSAIQSFGKMFEIARKQRAEKIVQCLNDLGFVISIDHVLEQAGGSPIGRPHIAEALVEKNCVFSIREAFIKYLGEGKPAYVPKFIVPPAKAIDIIKQAGGLVFLAHPRTAKITESDIQTLADMGMHGIETIHTKHTNRDIAYLQEIAQKYNLLQSGGTDCHGGREGGIILGTLSVPCWFLTAMKTKYGTSST